MDVSSEAFQKVLKDPKLISPEGYTGLLTEFLLTYKLDRIEELLLMDKDDQYYSVEVDYRDFEAYDACLSLLIVSHVSLLMPMFDDAVYDVMETVGKHAAFLAKYGRQGKPKNKVCVRIFHLPRDNHHLTKQSIGNLKASETRQFLQFTGTIVKTGPVRMLEASKTYRCRKCGYEFQVKADPEQNNILPVPIACPNWVDTFTHNGSNGGGSNANSNATDDDSLEAFMASAAAALEASQAGSSTAPQSQSQSSGGQRGRSKCPGKQLVEVEHKRAMIDYQEVKVQDQVERLELGRMPRSVKVVCDGDLVDRFNAGDDVVVVGSVIREWKPVFAGQRCSVDVAVKANSVVSTDHHKNQRRGLSSDDVARFKAFWAARRGKGSSTLAGDGVSDHGGDDRAEQEQEEQEESMRRVHPKEIAGRDFIVRSVCPMLYGLYYVKLALLLTLVGGTITSPPPSHDPHDSPTQHGNDNDNDNDIQGQGQGQSSVRVRQQAHLLLVGDPGCGKSQLLKFATMLVPRSVSTTGIGTSGAGLTATAVKEGNEYVVEAGALVLANDGVCCIDEFSSIKKDDRGTIHEAMEQQTISLAKAGLVVKLNARASVIACCNPKGNYDASADITTNTAISSSLLSRFDLVMILLDNPNKEWDKRVSTYLLTQAVRDGETGAAARRKKGGKGAGTATASASAADGNPPSSLASVAVAGQDEQWSVHTLRQYISFVRYSVQPTMTTAAAELLKKYYALQRQSDDRSASRTTTRLLESLVRLSEAHAKLMQRRHVLIEDSVTAISLMAMSGGGGGDAQYSLFAAALGTAGAGTGTGAGTGAGTGVAAASSLLQSVFPEEGQEYQHYQGLESRVLGLLHETRAHLLGASSGKDDGEGEGKSRWPGAEPPTQAQAQARRPLQSSALEQAQAQAQARRPLQSSALEQAQAQAQARRPCAPPTRRFDPNSTFADAETNAYASGETGGNSHTLWGSSPAVPAPAPAPSRDDRLRVTGSKRSVHDTQDEGVRVGGRELRSAGNVDIWGAAPPPQATTAPALRKPASFHSNSSVKQQQAQVHNPSYFEVDDDDW